jgi:hypothetical protein
MTFEEEFCGHGGRLLRGSRSRVTIGGDPFGPTRRRIFSTFFLHNLAGSHLHRDKEAETEPRLLDLTIQHGLSHRYGNLVWPTLCGEDKEPLTAKAAKYQVLE